MALSGNSWLLRSQYRANSAASRAEATGGAGTGLGFCAKAAPALKNSMAITARVNILIAANCGTQAGGYCFKKAPALLQTSGLFTLVGRSLRVDGLLHSASLHSQ